MRRIVITGIGIISPIGNSIEQVRQSLFNGKSGIVVAPDHIDRGFRSHVYGAPQINFKEHINKRNMRFMGGGAAYNFLAMRQAIKDSGLESVHVSHERTGLIVGSGGTSTASMFQAHQSLQTHNTPRRMGPFMVTRCMSSTNSACLATAFKIKGVNYSIASACSTSAHCIGNGVEQIQFNKQDIVFAGGGEELHWTLSCLFDAMGAMSSKYNATPQQASRPFDAARDGFVIAAGGGVVVLEELKHALCRGAKIYAEVTGYGATSDGSDMVAPSGEGGVRSMRLAISTIGDRKIDYINAHGTSTPIGDLSEIKAIRKVFGTGTAPIVASTKSLSGHSQGAAGVHEIIYCLIMLRDDFISASANIQKLDPEISASEIAMERIDNPGLDSILSNSFGFGGTNASLVISKYHR